MATWSFQVVGIDEARKRAHVERFAGTFTARLTKAQIGRFRGYPLLVAVVGFDDPREQATVSEPYLVRANAVGQAGGRE